MSDIKDKIIDLCKELYKTGIIPKIKDFEKYDIWLDDIQASFGTLQNLLEFLDVKVEKREKNQSKEEMKNYLLSIKKIDPNYDSSPGHRGLGSLCEKQCSCWTTDKYYKNVIRNTTQIYFNGKTQRIYRVSYLVFKGPVLNGMVVAHKCDNSECFNPDHLEMITQQKNVEDCVIRGRRVYDNKKSAVTRADRKEIKIIDPYDFQKLLQIIKKRIEISEKNEWLYNKSKTRDGYPEIWIGGKKYMLHRLILANKLGKKYEDIDIARHILPDGSQPQKNDINPEHLFEGNRIDNANDTLSHRKNTHLNSEQVTLIRLELENFDFKLFQYFDFDKQMSKKFDVPADVIRGVRTNTTYKNSDAKAYKYEKNQPVVQLDLNGNFIKIFESKMKAAETINNKNAYFHIMNSCNEKHKTGLGFIWMDLVVYENLLSSNSLKEEILRRKNSSKKSVVQLNSNMSLITTYESATKAAEVLGLFQSGISQACRKGNKCGGYFWMFEEEFNKKEVTRSQPS